MSKTTFNHGDTVTPEFLEAINNPVYSHDPQKDGEIPYPDPDGIGLTAEVERAETAEQGLQDQIDTLEPRPDGALLPRAGVNAFRWYLGSASYLDSQDSEFTDTPFESALILSASTPDQPRLAVLSLSMALSFASAPASSNTCALQLMTPDGVSAQLRDHLLLMGRQYFPCILLQPGANKSKVLIASMRANPLLSAPQPIDVFFLDPDRSSTTYTYQHLRDDFDAPSPSPLIMALHPQLILTPIPEV